MTAATYIHYDLIALVFGVQNEQAQKLPYIMIVNTTVADGDEESIFLKHKSI